MRCLTTTGLLTFFATIGGGIYTSFRMAMIAGEDCSAQLETFTRNLVNGSATLPEFDFNVSSTVPGINLPVTIPAFEFNATTELPAMTIPVEIFGQRFNLTIPEIDNITAPVNVPAQYLNASLPSLNLTLPVRIPPMLIRTSDILGKSLIDSANKLPDTAENLCYKVTLLTGLVYTSVAASMVALLTYAYHHNATLGSNVRELRRRVDQREGLGDRVMRTFRNISPPPKKTGQKSRDIELGEIQSRRKPRTTR